VNDRVHDRFAHRHADFVQLILGKAHIAGYVHDERFGFVGALKLRIEVPIDSLCLGLFRHIYRLARLSNSVK
jgi:hypothetical protein